MGGFVLVALFVIYFMIGIKLTERAQQHMHDPDKVYWFTPMYEPEKFTPRGNELRVKALRFWWGGAAVLILYALLF